MLADLLSGYIRDAAPMALLAQTALRALLDPEPLDCLFDDHAQQQYTRQLLFSRLVDLMADVVCRTQPSLRQAYTQAGDVPASLAAVYDKLSRLEPGVSQALVRASATRADALAAELLPAPPAWLGCRDVRLLDGNVLRASHHRLKVLRGTRASALAGLCVAVLDPLRQLVVDLFPCEDGHAQERRLLPDVLDTVRAGQLWVGDRNFCTTDFLGGLRTREAFFLIRRHASTVRCEGVGAVRAAGRSATGAVTEQAVCLSNVVGPDGPPVVRHIVVTLDRPTRDGETELRLLTNLPAERADAVAIADGYQQRWQIEALFQRLTVVLHCELRPLGYPRAALFGFAVAVLASNAWSVVTAALQAAQPTVRVREEISYAQVGLELVQSRKLLAALGEPWWEPLLGQPVTELAAWLRAVAGGVRWARYVKTGRGPKKPRPHRPKCPRYRHVSTQKLLDAEKKKKREDKSP